jgi:hypothetical protein
MWHSQFLFHGDSSGSCMYMFSVLFYVHLYSWDLEFRFMQILAVFGDHYRNLNCIVKRVMYQITDARR